jgi:hypothetical protein
MPTQQFFSYILCSVPASSAVDRGFEPRSGQTKDYKIGICCFSKTGWLWIEIMCQSGATCLENHRPVTSYDTLYHIMLYWVHLAMNWVWTHSDRHWFNKFDLNPAGQFCFMFILSILCVNKLHVNWHLLLLQDWLALNRNNVSEWGHMSIHRLLFQWASTMKKSNVACWSRTKWTSSSFHLK